MAKKVLRYTEEEFVTLLENIVNRVKKKKDQKNLEKQKQRISERRRNK